MARGKEFPLSIIFQAVDKATSKFSKIESSVSRLGKRVAQTGKTLSTNLTLPIVGIGAASVSALSTFQQGMSNVSTLIDTSTENIEGMGNSVLAIGRRTPVAMTDLTAALFDVRSAGVSAAQQFEVLEQSARLGKAGLGTTQQAVDLVTSSLNAFQLEGQDAARVYDVIFKTTKFGKTTIAGLAQGFGAVAGTVHATGTKLDEYLASVSALTTTGLPAAQAHSQLRAVMSGLTRETDKSRKVFRKLGAKDFKDLIATSGGLVPALQKISGTLGGNEAKILDLVGSTEALNAVLGLTKGQNEAYVNTLTEMRKGANAVDEAFGKQNKTLQSQMQRTKNALTSAGVSLGRVLIPVLNKVSDVLQRVSDWFAGLDKGTKKWIVTIGGVVATVGPALLIIGKLAGAVGMVSTAVRILGMVLLGNPIGLLVTAIGSAALLIYRYWGPISSFFKDLWDRVSSLFGDWLGWVKGAFLNFTPLGLIIKHWGPIVNVFKKLWNGVVRIFEWARNAIGKIVDKILGPTRKVIDAARTVAGFLSDPTGSAFDNVGAPDAGSIAARKARMRVGRLLEPRTRRLLPNASAAAMAPQVQRSEAHVVVDVRGLPRGSRVEVDPKSDASVDLTAGYQMGVP